ncbi:restriction endonuclease subunit S [Bacillus sp. GBSW19]|uniref:restriction endonuclease subunit S n=1 Tax=Bacillus sp. GBSW19 TaxID=2108545 RepID=UPI0007611A02|nr:MULTISPECIES: restriction endonuclease subunit S [Bacillus]PRS58904.1 restriction endonuclease subunit S [Bacillus sp. GBSW19]
MSDKITKSPQIRFTGFADAWEQRRLVDTVKEVLDYRGKSPAKFGMEWGNKGYLVLSALNVKDGYIDKSVEAKYGDQELFEMWMGERRLEKGDVLFTTEAPLGNIAQVPDDDGYILNQRTVAFKTDDRKTNNDFLAQLLRSPLVQEKLNANASGGTAKGIGMKEFSKLRAYVSSQVEEQKKIGVFFSNLDNLITLHQRKLELLKDTKKSLLQKMFPKDGANFPEIRLAGFTDVWEQRKLGEITKIKTGSSDLQDAVGDGEYPFFVRSENIERSNRWIFDGEAILIPGEGRLGEIYHYINGKFDYHQRVYKISNFTESVTDGKYILYYMQRNFKRHALKFTVKATVDSLRLPMLTEFEVVLPSLEEQRKVSAIFSHLNNLITLHQRELNSLKNLKKSLLQQMFI